ncbi:MAG: hypothetical protein U0350_15605 [Caldilineaceae bacterium]
MPEPTLLRPNNYTAYLVRMWQEKPNTPWRAFAQCASTGEKFYFATLAELFAFLQAQTEAGSPGETGPPAADK